jgi:hypothetical protein
MQGMARVGKVLRGGVVKCLSFSVYFPKAQLFSAGWHRFFYQMEILLGNAESFQFTIEVGLVQAVVFRSEA